MVDGLDGAPRYFAWCDEALDDLDEAISDYAEDLGGERDRSARVHIQMNSGAPVAAALDRAMDALAMTIEIAEARS